MPTLTDGSSVDVCDVEHTSADLPSRKPLTFNDYLFIDACLDTIHKYGHLDQIEAYRSVWKEAKYTSAAVSAHRKLKRVEIKEAIEARLRYEGLTKEAILSTMLEVVERAKLEGKLDTVLTGCMDIMRARGEIIDKKDVTTHDEARQAPIRQLVDQAIGQTGKG